jgi:hypothetical protein
MSRLPTDENLKGLASAGATYEESLRAVYLAGYIHAATEARARIGNLVRSMSDTEEWQAVLKGLADGNH